MKCPYCGGEVPAQSITCPYCGKENPEGIAFQQEVQDKIKRNKLLKPFLIKQKKPELIQKMMTRIIVIIIVVNVVLMGFILLVAVFSNREEVRVPTPGSFAEQYLEEYQGIDDYYFDSYYREVKKQVEILDNGEIPEETEVINLVTDAHRALEESEGEEIHEKIYLYETAFFRGFLGLKEDESLFLEPDKDGKYGILFSDDERVKVAVEAILDKYREVR